MPGTTDTVGVSTPIENSTPAEHVAEAHSASHASLLNWLRAAVLGANDGIVSVAGLVIGVAGATPAASALLTAGVAGLTAGSLSMAVGEYVSVSTQRDTEKALIDKERRELAEMPAEELEELTQLYQAKGLDRSLAEQVAVRLTEHDALGAHAEAELGIDPEEFTNPWQAAGASMVAFALGGLVPLLAILLLPAGAKVAGTVVAVVLALVLTGWGSARLGGADQGRAIVRNVLGGLVAMGITYGIGMLVGTRVD